MVFTRKKEFINLSSGSVALGSSAQWRLSRQPRRLESLLLRVNFTTDSSAATASKVSARFGILAAIKRIKFHVNDRAGNRDCIDLTGANLASFLTNVGVKLDRNTLQAMPAGLVVSTAYTATFRIPMRHPQVAEPFGNFLSIPLDESNLNDDPYLQVDFETSGNLLSAGAISGVAAKVQAIYREVPIVSGSPARKTPYLPWELSQTVIAPSTARFTYEFPTVGVLTGFLLQAYDTTTFAGTFPLTSTGSYQLKYGTDQLEETDDLFQEAANDSSRDPFPAVLSGATTLPTMQPRQESFFDFFTEEDGQDAYSVNSTINLDSKVLAGDKLRLTFADLADTSTTVEITSHRLLPNSLDELKLLAVAV